MRPRRLVAAHTALPTSKAARDVDDGSSRECSVCRLLRRCTQQRAASRTLPCVVRVLLRLLRAALASFHRYVRPFIAVDRPLIVSCPEQGSPRCGASTTTRGRVRRRRWLGCQCGCACVEISVVGLRCGCQVGRGLDVVGGTKVSRVLSSRGGGPTRSERLCDSPRRGTLLPTTLFARRTRELRRERCPPWRSALASGAAVDARSSSPAWCTLTSLEHTAAPSSEHRYTARWDVGAAADTGEAR